MLTKVYEMAANKNGKDGGKDPREARLEKIKALTGGKSEDAAKVLKYWMSKEAADKGKN